MADPRHSRLMAEMFVEMLHEKIRQFLVLIQSIKYLMLMTYVPQSQSGVVSVNPALLDQEDSFDWH